MAPRKSKTDDDSHDETGSLASEVLKPKTAKAKVTKPKVEKPKVDKVKTEKVKKAVAAKDGVEKVKKELAATAKEEPVVKDAAATGAKEKVKVVTGEEAMKVMEAYLKEQNRPYSATEVSVNLHGKVCLPTLPVVM